MKVLAKPKSIKDLGDLICCAEYMDELIQARVTYPEKFIIIDLSSQADFNWKCTHCGDDHNWPAAERGEPENKGFFVALQFVDIMGEYCNGLVEMKVPRMIPVNYYGCVKCQQQHFEDTQSKLYKDHIMWQSKHGIQQLHETLEERKNRYAEAEKSSA